MTATNELLQSFYRLNFDKISDYESFENFVKSSIEFSKEIHLQNKNNDELLMQLPLLAIVSKLFDSFPTYTRTIAIEEPIIQAALDILEGYSDEKRLVLEKHFL